MLYDAKTRIQGMLFIKLGVGGERIIRCDKLAGQAY